MADCERHSDVAFLLGDKSFSAHRYVCKCNMEGGRQGERRGGEGRGRMNQGVNADTECTCRFSFVFCSPFQVARLLQLTLYLYLQTPYTYRIHNFILYMMTI